MARALAAAARVLCISGPNLQLLGTREPESTARRRSPRSTRGSGARRASSASTVDARQTNHEGTLVDWIGEARESGFAGILLNPGAYTHTSIAHLRRAQGGRRCPASRFTSRTPSARGFRRRSRIAPACVGRVAGFGARQLRARARGARRDPRASSVRVRKRDSRVRAARRACFPARRPSRLKCARPTHEFDLEKLRALFDLLAEKDIAEFEHEEDGVRVRVVARRARRARRRVRASPTAHSVAPPAACAERRRPRPAPSRRRLRRRDEPLRRQLLPLALARRARRSSRSARSSAPGRRSASSKR